MRRAAVVLLLAFAAAPRAGWAQGGDPIGPEFRVNTYTSGGQLRPSVAADSSGNFVVVWESEFQDTSGHGIFGQRYASSGAPVGLEFRVNTYTSGHQYRPAVASDAFGGFVVVWYGLDGTSVGVFGQRYDAAGSPTGPEFRVNTFTTGNQRYPSIAADNSGNFVVVWASYGQDGSQSGVFGQRYDASGVPLGPEFPVNTYTTGQQIYPFVAADASGHFVVTWESDMPGGSLRDVFAQRYASSGDPLGLEFRVNTYTSDRQDISAVAADPSGNFVVVWNSWDQDGSFRGIFGQRYSNSGGPLGPEFRVNTYTTFYQEGRSIAADALGNFIVVWTSTDGQDGSGNGIFGQRYDAAGAPLGPEFRVNTYTTGNQFASAVAADTSGHFVVVWHGAMQDGASYGILGQRYSQIVPVELMRFGVE